MKRIYDAPNPPAFRTPTAAPDAAHRTASGCAGRTRPAAPAPALARGASLARPLRLERAVAAIAAAGPLVRRLILDADYFRWPFGLIQYFRQWRQSQCTVGKRTMAVPVQPAFCHHAARTMRGHQHPTAAPPHEAGAQSSDVSDRINCHLAATRQMVTSSTRPKYLSRPAAHLTSIKNIGLRRGRSGQNIAAFPRGIRPTGDCG